MKAPQGIVDLLNRLLVGELTAINQYFLGAKICRQRGLSRLAKHLRQESLDEMKHAEALVERVVGSSRVDLQACKLEYSIVSPK